MPWLGDLPVIGNLFKTTSNQDANTELLIFVTPKILKEDLQVGGLADTGAVAGPQGTDPRYMK